MYLFKVWFSLDISPRMRLQDNMVSPYPEGIYFCFIDYTKVFDCVDDNKLWKILKEMGIPDHVIYLLRSLYTGQDQQLKPDMEQWAGSKLGTKISNQAIKEINPENSLEALLWKLMLQYTGRLLR